MVANEVSDAKNHSQLMSVGQALFEDIYVELFPLASEPLYGANVVSFQQYKVKKKLTEVLFDFCITK